MSLPRDMKVTEEMKHGPIENSVADSEYTPPLIQSAMRDSEALQKIETFIQAILASRIPAINNAKSITERIATTLTLLQQARLLPVTTHPHKNTEVKRIIEETHDKLLKDFNLAISVEAKEEKTLLKKKHFIDFINYITEEQLLEKSIGMYQSKINTKNIDVFITTFRELITNIDNFRQIKSHFGKTKSKLRHDIGEEQAMINLVQYTKKYNEIALLFSQKLNYHIKKSDLAHIKATLLTPTNLINAEHAMTSLNESIRLCSYVLSDVKCLSCLENFEKSNAFIISKNTQKELLKRYQILTELRHLIQHEHDKTLLQSLAIIEEIKPSHRDVSSLSIIETVKEIDDIETFKGTLDSQEQSITYFIAANASIKNNITTTLHQLRQCIQQRSIDLIDHFHLLEYTHHKENQKRGIPEAFLCHKTKLFMENPALGTDGNSYEDAILRLNDANPTQTRKIATNYALKTLIEAYKNDKNLFKKAIDHIPGIQCAITQTTMFEPITTNSGQSYERSALMKVENNKDPITREKITSKIRNHAIENSLRHYISVNPNQLYSVIENWSDEFIKHHVQPITQWIASLPVTNTVKQGATTMARDKIHLPRLELYQQEEKHPARRYVTSHIRPYDIKDIKTRYDVIANSSLNLGYIKLPLKEISLIDFKRIESSIKNKEDVIDQLLEFQYRLKPLLQTLKGLNPFNKQEKELRQAIDDLAYYLEKATRQCMAMALKQKLHASRPAQPARLFERQRQNDDDRASSAQDQAQNAPF